MSSTVAASIAGAASASSSPVPPFSSPMTRRPTSTRALDSGTESCGPTHFPMSVARYFARKLTTFERPTSRSPSLQGGEDGWDELLHGGPEVVAVSGVPDAVHEAPPRGGQLLELGAHRQFRPLVVTECLPFLE